MSRWLLVLALVAPACVPKPSPDDLCRTPCEEAIGRVDVYRLDGKVCTCYRAADDATHAPGAFVEVPL